MSDRKIIAQHAATVLVGQIAVIGFGMADTVITGRYSPQAQAVLALASSIYISIFVALNGLIQALLPVWAELRGAGREADIGRSVRQALYITGLSCVMGMVLMSHPDPWLAATEVPVELWPEVRHYMQVLALALVPSLLFRLYGTLNQSLGLPRLVSWLQAGALLVKVPLSAWFTFGGLGLPGMGVVGCAWATLVVYALMLSVGLVLLRTQDLYLPYRFWLPLERPQWPVLRRFLALGIPAGLSVMVEVTSFTMMALFIARQGAAALASHQIATSIAALLFMLPLALGIATSARTGYWLGARQPARARHAAGQGVVLALVMALFCALLLWTLRHPLAQAFSKDEQVAAAAGGWLAWVAVYHLGDALQGVCLFVLRCYRITLAPLLIYATLLWGVGLYGGYTLAYQGLGPWAARHSVDAFWIMSTVAVSCVSVLFLGLLWHKASALRHQHMAPQPATTA